MRLLGNRGNRKSGGLGKERDSWMACHIDGLYRVRRRLMGNKYVRLRSGTDGGFVGLGFVIFRLVFKIIIRNSASRGAWLVLKRLLLCCNFFCGEKPTARPSRAAHGMLMAGFVEIWLKEEHEKQRERERETGKMDADLALTRKAMEFLQSSASYTSLENTKVLLCIDIERFVVKIEGTICKLL